MNITEKIEGNEEMLTRCRYPATAEAQLRTIEGSIKYLVDIMEEGYNLIINLR